MEKGTKVKVKIDSIDKYACPSLLLSDVIGTIAYTYSEGTVSVHWDNGQHGWYQIADLEEVVPTYTVFSMLLTLVFCILLAIILTLSLPVKAEETSPNIYIKSEAQIMPLVYICKDFLTEDAYKKAVTKSLWNMVLEEPTCSELQRKLEKR